MAAHFKLSLVFVLLSLLGCERASTLKAQAIGQGGIFTQIELMRTPNRNLASLPKGAGGGRCLKDRLSLEGLKADIAALEATQGLDRPASGRWKGLALSNVTKGQIQYLAQGGSYLPSNVRDTGCASLYCFLNQIYENTENSIEAYLLYYIWLKSGVYINSGGSINPNYKFSNYRDYESSGKQVDKDDLIKIKNKINLLNLLWTDEEKNTPDGLMSREELRGLWKINQLIPNSFNNMSSLQVVYRAPKEKYIYDTGMEKLTPVSCAISYGSNLKGSVTLMDLCSDQIGKRPIDAGSTEGYFYSTIIHEMAHNFDRLSYVSKALDTSLSVQKEWLGIGQWSLISDVETEESIDRKLNDKVGSVSKKWARSDSAEPPISDYGKSSPKEDFAEAVTYYRLNAKTMKENAPKRYQFIKEKVYGEKAFDQESLKNFFQSRVINGVIREFPLELKGCFDSPVIDAEASLKATVWGVEIGDAVSGFINPKTLECMRSRITKLIENGIDELRWTEWDACSYFKNEVEVKIFVTEVMSQLSERVLAWISNQKETGRYAERVLEIRKKIETGIDAREVFRVCFGQLENPTSNNLRECFARKALEALNQLTQDEGSEWASLKAQEIDRWIKANSFDTTEKKVWDLVQEVYWGIEPTLESAAKQRWEACKDSPPIHEEMGLYTPFVFSDPPIRLGIIDCINRSMTSDLGVISDQVSKKLGMSSLDLGSKKLFATKYTQAYLDRLKQVTKNAVADEWTKIEKEKDQYRLSAERILSQGRWMIENNPLIACLNQLENLEFSKTSPYFEDSVLLSKLRVEACRERTKRWTPAVEELWKTRWRAKLQAGIKDCKTRALDRRETCMTAYFTRTERELPAEFKESWAPAWIEHVRLEIRIWALELLGVM